MASKDIQLHVVYSAEKPSVDANSFLCPTYSPMQNYSELYVQREVFQKAVSPSAQVGFFHVRRYLNLSKIYRLDELSPRVRPYHFQKYPHAQAYSGDSLAERLGAYDMIAPVPERTYLRVAERYARYANHRATDLDAAVEILLEKYPRYQQAAERYLSGTQEFYGNMYVMSGRYFNEYAAWLFDILSEFDRRVTEQLPRTPGYLSERLFGIWLTQKMEDESVKIGFAPRVHFYGYDDKTHSFKHDWLVSMLLPPGSKRRFWVKEGIRHGKHKKD